VNAIFLVSKLTVRETVRSRTYGFIVILALVSFACIHLFSDFTSQEQEKFLKDAGLAMITFCSLIVGVFLGTSPIQSDIENKNIYTYLTNPSALLHYLLGRFLGSALLIGLTILIMGIVFYLYLIVQRLNIFIEQSHVELRFLDIIKDSIQKGFFSNLNLFKVFITIFLQGTIICSISFLFSSLLTSSLAIACSILIFLLSHFTNFLIQTSFLYNAFWGHVLQVLFIGLPNFENFNIADAIVLGQGISFQYIGWLTIYSVFLWVIYLSLSHKFISVRSSNF